MASIEESIIKTRIGPLRLELIKFGRRGNDDVHHFEFDCEADEEGSHRVLADNHEMTFTVYAKKKGDRDFAVYLGSPESASSEKLRYDDLLIRLQHPESTKDPRTDWWGSSSKPKDKDVKDFKRNYWGRAKARATLLVKEKEEEAWRVVQRQDGDPVTTRLRLGYHDDYKELHDDILESLSESGIHGRLTSPLERSIDSEDTVFVDAPAPERYERLLTILKRCEDLLERILREPASQLQPRLATHAPLSRGEAEAFFSTGGRNVNVAHLHQALPTRQGLLPVRFTSVETHQSMSTPANAFVLHSMERMLDVMQEVKERLQGEVELLDEQLDKQTHPDAIKELNRDKRGHEEEIEKIKEDAARFLRYRRKWRSKCYDAGRPQKQAGYSQDATLYYDNRYATLRELTQRLDRELRYANVPSSEENLSGVEAFNKLYERWCFVKIVEALLEIGFRFEQGKDWERTPYYQNPRPNDINCEMWHPDIPPSVHLEVWYDKLYQRLDRENEDYERGPYGLEKASGQGSESSKRKPDIALEFHRKDARCPDIVIFDATTGPKKDGEENEKYRYKESIRSFVETDSYGKKLKIVKAAWGIHPRWNSRRPQDWVDPEYDHYEKGFIVLQPNEESVRCLAKSVGKILSEVDILPTEP